MLLRLVAREDNSAPGLHALPRRWLARLYLVFLLILVFIILVLVSEVLALLELLVSNLNVLLVVLLEIERVINDFALRSG
jgi:hypothetical protein